MENANNTHHPHQGKFKSLSQKFFQLIKHDVILVIPVIFLKIDENTNTDLYAFNTQHCKFVRHLLIPGLFYR